MKLFPHSLKDKEMYWLFTIDREFTSWRQIEEAFLNFYPLGQMHQMRRNICGFTQKSSETLHEAWENLKIF